jgi:hypothetical protein
LISSSGISASLAKWRSDPILSGRPHESGSTVARCSRIFRRCDGCRWHQQSPAAAFDKASEFTAGQGFSYGDFKNALLANALGLGDVDRKAALDGLTEIAHQLFHGFALSRAAGNSRDLGPKPTLLRIMHNDFDLHAGFPEGAKEGVFRLGAHHK